LAEHGAVVIDSDVLAREAVGAGTEGLATVVREFGDSVLGQDGVLDRARLAAVVFADPGARRDLEALVHPAVRAGVAERVAALAAAGDGGGVVVVEIPLLVESPASRAGLASVIVVDCPEDVAVARLVAARGMSEADARARVAAQASRGERLALAGFVVDNSGTVADLAAEVDRCSDWLEGLRAAGAAGER
ncbi:MAG: dephospho-CoA kinase, partial [Acidimicrobiales bacterium]